jgi:MFS family permease
MSVLSPVMGDLSGRVGVRPLLVAGSVIVAAGCLLGLRIGGAGGYWAATAPGVVVFALGMSCAAAPLTGAVLASVDERHTGVASGLNSAVARTGGLIATALLGRVLAARGEGLDAAFRIALVAAAVAALSAGLCAFVLVRPQRKTPAAGDSDGRP